MDAYDGLSQLVRRIEDIEGISGVFSGGENGPTRVEIYRDGRVLASDQLDAERWLLIAHGLDNAC